MRKRNKRNHCQPMILRLCLLGVFFCAGLLLGLLAYRLVGTESRGQLEDYVHQYISLCQNGQAVLSFLSVVTSYVKYPLAAFLLGHTAFKRLLLPFLCSAEGFGLSFTVRSFSASLGTNGILMALVLLGLRAFITVPCTLYISSLAMGAKYQRNDYVRVGICACIVFLGAVLEAALIPDLFIDLFAG